MYLVDEFESLVELLNLLLVKHVEHIRGHSMATLAAFL